MGRQGKTAGVFAELAAPMQRNYPVQIVLLQRDLELRCVYTDRVGMAKE